MADNTTAEQDTTITDPGTVDPRVAAALAGLERAQQSVAEGEQVLRSKQGELSALRSKLTGLEKAILGGDLEAPGEHRRGHAELEDVAREAYSIEEAVKSRRETVELAEAKVLIAEALAGLNGLADEEEQDRRAEALAEVLRPMVIELVREARETDRAITRAAIALDPHRYKVPGLQVHGEGWQSEAFAYQGHQFKARAEFKLESAFKRAWSDVQTVLYQELVAEREGQEQGSGNPDGGRLPLLSPRV